MTVRRTFISSIDPRGDFLRHLSFRTFGLVPDRARSLQCEAVGFMLLFGVERIDDLRSAIVDRQP